MEQMTSGSFRLNRRFFEEKKLVINKHRLSLEEQVSYPTLLKYISSKDKPYDIRTFSGDVLYAIMARGMGLTDDEIADLRIGDIFEIVDEAA